MRREDLKRLFAPIQELGHREKTFDLNGVPVTIRTLRPREEASVQRWASGVLEGETERTQATFIEYLDRVKIGSLSYSIVAIGDTSLREELISTGELLENGVEKKVQKNLEVRAILEDFSRAMITALFKKFAELVDEVELQIGSAVVFEALDYDTEIKQLQERLQTLQNKKKQQEKEIREGIFGADVHSKTVKEVARRNPKTGALEANQKAGEQPQEQEVVSTEVPLERKGSGLTDAHSVIQPAPEQREHEFPESAIPRRATPPPRPQGNPAQEAFRPTNRDNSLVGKDNLESAIAAENQMLEMERRQREAQDSQRRRLEQMTPVSLDALRSARRLPDQDGVPTYHIDAGELPRNLPKEAVADRVNPPETNSLNPRFRRANK